MATQSKSITVQMSGWPIHLKMEVATVTEARTKVVCTNGGEHDAVAVKQNIVCPICNKTESSYFGFPERAVVEKKQLKVLGLDEIKQSRGVPRTGRKMTDKDGRLMAEGGEVTLRFHPRSEVFASTLAGDSVQNVYPDIAAGGAKGYQMLVQNLTAHPDLVATMIWAAGSVNAIWVMEIVDGRLVASKRCWPEDAREIREITQVTVSEAEQAVFDQVVALSVDSFNVNDYVNEAKRGLEELLKDRVSPDEVSVGGNELELLQKLLESVKAQRGAVPSKAA